MNEEILLVADSVSNEKDLPKETIFEAIEFALASAVKKRYKEEVNILVDINQTTGDYESFRYKDVVDFENYEDSEVHILVDSDFAEENELKVGDIFKEQVENADFGRIAAQAAKQVIVQKVRDAERLEIIKRFRPSLGQLVSGSVKKVTREFIIVDLGDGAEASLPRKDLIQGEIYRVGDRIKGILEESIRENRGPQLVLSRSSKEMVSELFKLEVPEIAEEVIEIRAVAREAGARTKIAVKTNDARIDPVGACVGMRGSRVQAVSNELGNERIDIVVWEDDQAKLLVNTLSPAEILSIVMDDENQSMEVVVKDENLALAIGKNGQNIRLTSELLGWQIQIKGESSNEDNPEASKLIEYLGVDRNLAAKLIESGFETVQKISESKVEDFSEIEGFDEDIISTIIERAEESLMEIALLELDEDDSDSISSKEARIIEANDGFTEEEIKLLSENEITTIENLADLATDELTEVLSIDDDKAAKLIMTAREEWFED
ncbi:MAG: transcription termination/antitermination protein NusA [Gammaproteobacteria bacterium]|nr:MAG: transcription termination/antitermination protein NusA [Gammaproteobacteria bacterium]